MLNKSRIYPVVLILIVFLVWKIRDRSKPVWYHLTGPTMGTTYNVKYADLKNRDFQLEVDSILRDFNQSLSTYIPDSEVSLFNKDSVLSFSYRGPYFRPVLIGSAEVNSWSLGAFDPTVMPLVKAWGFGPGIGISPDSIQVDSIRQFVGFGNIHFDGKQVSKSGPGVELDFSAIAKGYGCDVIASYLIDQDISNLFVEIGGEVVAQGINQNDQIWRVGIEKPQADATSEPQIIVALNNRAMATSGNYRNFYVRDGIRYAHTIDPRNGFPVTHSLLSATVFAPDGMKADALATAFMVIGVDSALLLIDQVPEVDGLFIYSDKQGGLKVSVTGGVEVLEEKLSDKSMSMK